MKNDEANSSAGWRAALSVFYSAMLVVTLLGAIIGALEVLQTDFFQENPHRSGFHAISLAVFLGPLFGLWFLIGYCLSALIFAMTLAGFFTMRPGKLPLRILVAAFPLYWGLIYLQYDLLPDYNLYSDLPEQIEASRNPVGPATVGTVLLLAVFTFSWWRLKQQFARLKS
ncbi:MAG: hypothetical protein NXI02_30040 [Rhodobacteraceae bacterium]|nr:hypothetical protein [Paracoccaceae bacterium]